MADLPKNIEYNIPEDSVLPDSFFQNLGGKRTPTTIGEQLAAKGVPSQRTPSSLTNLNDMFSGEPLIPTGEAVQRSFQGKEAGRIEPLPKDHTPFRYPSTTPQGFQWEQPQEEQVLLRKVPGEGIPGQWMTDPTQPREPIKVFSGVTERKRKLLLAGRPSFMYEVDHIIPLWVGGADTDDNLQILRRAKHAEKTKAQAIPYTLMVNNKITPSEAKFYTMTWEDRDLSDMPNYDASGITVPLEDALDIKERWDRQISEPVNLRFFSGKDWKNFFKAIPESGDKLFTKVRKELGFKQPLTKEGSLFRGVSDLMEETTKGVASGLTAGWVRYRPDDDDGWIQQLAGMGGVIGGSLAPISLISKGMGLTSRTLAHLLKFDKGVSKVLGAGKATLNARGVETVLKSPLTSRLLLRDMAFKNWGKTLTSQLKGVPGFVGTLVKMGLPFSIYGQLSPEGLAGKAFIKDDEMIKPLKHFFTDMAYGMAFAGGMSGRMKWLDGKKVIKTKDLVLRTSEEALKISALSAAISVMTNPGAPSREHLINAGIMAALHSIGAPKDIKAQKKISLKMLGEIDEGARAMASNLINTRIPKRIKFVKAGEKAPEPGYYSKEQLSSFKAELLEGIEKDFKNGHLNLRDKEDEIRSMMAALSVLETGTLPSELRYQKTLDDLFSLTSQTERSGGHPQTTSLELCEFVGGLDKKIVRDLNVKNRQAESSLEGQCTGEGRVAGLASGQNANVKEVKRFLAKEEEGLFTKGIIYERRKDFETKLRALNNVITEKEISQNLKRIHENPQNVVSVYGYKIYNDGRRTVEFLGFDSRASHISESGTIHAYNNVSKRWRKEQGKDWGGEQDPLYLEPRYNKDLKAKAMDDNDIRFLLGTISKSAPEAVRSKEPYIIASVAKPHWDYSIKQNQALQKLGTRPVPDLVKDFNSSVGTKQRNRTIKELQEKVIEPSDKVLEKFPAEPSDSYNSTKELFRDAREALSGQNIDDFASRLNKHFDIDLDEKSLLSLFNRRSTLTNKEFLSLIETNSAEGIRSFVEEAVRPFLNSTSFKNWEYGKTFPELRVLGSLKKTETTVAPVSSKKAAKEVLDQPVDKVSSLPPEPSKKPSAEKEVLREIPEEAPIKTQIEERIKPQAQKTFTQKISEKAKSFLDIKKPIKNLKKEPWRDPSQYEEPFSPFSQKIELKQKKVKPVTKKSYETELIENEIHRGETALEEVQFTTREGEGALGRALLSVVDKFKVAFPKKESFKGRSFSAIDKRRISERVKKELGRKIEPIVTKKSEIDNALEFVNISKGDELYFPAKMVKEAQIRAKLGDKSVVKITKEEMGEMIFPEISKPVIKKLYEKHFALLKDKKKALIEVKKELGEDYYAQIDLILRE